MDSSGLEAIPTNVLVFACSSVRLAVKRYIQSCVSTMSFLRVFISLHSPLALSPITLGQADQVSLRHSHHNYSTPEESIIAKHHYFQNGAKH